MYCGDALCDERPNLGREFHRDHFKAYSASRMAWLAIWVAARLCCELGVVAPARRLGDNGAKLLCRDVASADDASLDEEVTHQQGHGPAELIPADTRRPLVPVFISLSSTTDRRAATRQRYSSRPVGTAFCADCATRRVSS